MNPHAVRSLAGTAPANTALADTALANTEQRVFWTDTDSAPSPRDPLRGSRSADLVIVGGGFTGLWAALQAVEEQPGIDVVVLESSTIGFGASGRNGGFCDASLTHGLENGLSHWPDEIETLVRMGRENLDGYEADLARHDIDASFERTGELGVAREQWQLDELAESAETHRSHGDDVELLDSAGTRALLDSPAFIGGLFARNDTALVDPARVVWGLAEAAERLGVRVHEQSPVEGVSRHGRRLVVRTDRGSVVADRAIVATNAFARPLRRVRRRVIPVWDHVLMTEPLSTAQMASIGWSGRQGVGDAANQFHYFRLTDDNRILWGGYDANYHFGNTVDMRHEVNAATHRRLASNFFETFPQLEGIGFTHKWGGPIGTSSKFSVTFGQTHQGRLAWVGGYTGLGVGASRWGARVALDLVSGVETESTQLAIVHKQPMAFPPEPLRWPVVQLTRRAIQRADRRDGKRGPWLRLLDVFGVGFDS